MVMIDVDVIKSLRNEKEFVNYFKDKGLKLKQEEIENLINNKKGNEINICQLDKVVGGINFVKNPFFIFRKLENRFVLDLDWKPHVSLNGVQIKDEHVRALFGQTEDGLMDLLVNYKDKLQKQLREAEFVSLGTSVAGFVIADQKIQQVDEMLNCCREHKALNTETICKVFDKVYDAEGFAASLLKNIDSIPVSLRQELKQEKPKSSLQQEVRADGSAIYLNGSVFATKNSMTEYTYYDEKVEHAAYFYTNVAKTSVFLFRDNMLLEVTHRSGDTMLVRDHFKQTLYFIPDSFSPLCEAKLEHDKVLYKFSGKEYRSSLPAKVIVPKEEPKKEKTPSLETEHVREEPSVRKGITTLDQQSIGMLKLLDERNRSLILEMHPELLPYFAEH